MSSKIDRPLPPIIQPTASSDRMSRERGGAPEPHLDAHYGKGRIVQDGQGHVQGRGVPYPSIAPLPSPNQATDAPARSHASLSSLDRSSSSNVNVSLPLPSSTGPNAGQSRDQPSLYKRSASVQSSPSGDATGGPSPRTWGNRSQAADGSDRGAPRAWTSGSHGNEVQASAPSSHGHWNNRTPEPQERNGPRALPQPQRPYGASGVHGIHADTERGDRQMGTHLQASPEDAERRSHRSGPGDTAESGAQSWHRPSSGGVEASGNGSVRRIATGSEAMHAVQGPLLHAVQRTAPDGSGDPQAQHPQPSPGAGPMPHDVISQPSGLDKPSDSRTNEPPVRSGPAQARGPRLVAKPSVGSDARSPTRGPLTAPASVGVEDASSGHAGARLAPLAKKQGSPSRSVSRGRMNYEAIAPSSSEAKPYFEKQADATSSANPAAHAQPLPPPTGALGQAPIPSHTPRQMDAPSASAMEANQTHKNASSGRQLKVEDALAYLEQVKTQFEGQPMVYNDFLDIMKEFKAQTIDTTEVIKRVSQLFRGHKELILGFNTFLPPGYKIEVRENLETGILSAGFSGPGGFSELPDQRRAPDSRSLHPAPGSVPNHGPAITAKSEAAVNATLPNGSQQAPKPTQVTATHTKKRTTVSPRKKESKPKMSLPAAGAAVAHPNVSSAPASTAPAEPPAVARPPATRVPETNTTATSGQVGPRPEPHQRPPASVEHHAPVAQTDTSSPSLPRKQADFERALEFMDRLKQQLSEEDYRRFVEELESYRTTPVGYRVIASVLSDLCGPENKDLLQDFLEQLPAPAQPRGQASGASSKRMPGKGIGGSSKKHTVARVGPEADFSKGLQGHASPCGARGKTTHKSEHVHFFEEVRVQLGGSSARLYIDFIKCLRLFSLRIIEREELLHMAAELFRNHDRLHAMFVQHLDSIATGAADVGHDGQESSASSAQGPGLGSGQGAGDQQRAALYRSKPMSEIAADSETPCGPSYKKLPADYPVLMCSGRSALEKRSLNDVWISVTSGSEDYSFKFMRKNQYEDNLFRCEDDRYELDLVIETNAATIVKLEEIASTIDMLPPSVKRRHSLAEGALSAVHFNAIKRIYGGAGADIIQHVRLNPGVAVPVVLARLRDKDEQWRRARQEMNVIWREVGEKNYHRSLDHRSVHFKQVDKKELSSKSLVMDIMNPYSSHQARQGEMTRARGYNIPCGGGRANDRSGAADAIAMLARLGPTDGPPALPLPYIEHGVHETLTRLVEHWVNHSAHGRDDSGDGSRTALANYKRFAARFFAPPGDTPSVDSGEESKAPQSQLLFGDETLYILMRLHQLLYERLAAAKGMAKESTEDQKRRNAWNADGLRGLVQSSKRINVVHSPHELTKDFLSATREADKFELNSGIQDPDALYEAFVQLAESFVVGHTELTKYEDKCRVLLGPDAYCLATLDKTLQKFSKQMLLVFADESQSSEFVRLFERASERSSTSRSAAGRVGSEDMYSIAASAALRKRRGAGAHLFRMEFLPKRDAASELRVHVVGSTCNDDDDQRRALESAALDQFLSFPVGLSALPPRADALVRNDHSLIGDDGPMEDSENEESPSNLSTDAKDDPSSIAGGDDDSGGSSARGDAQSGAIAEDSALSGRHLGAEMQKRVARLVSNAPFLRYTGSAARIAKGRVIMRNEIESRVDSQGRLSFVDGKADVFIYLCKKRRRSEACGSAERSDDQRPSKWVRKFRAYVEESHASWNRGKPPLEAPVENSAKMDVDTAVCASE